MGAYLARRLLALLPTLLIASLIVFITIRLIPGDVIDLMLSQNDVAADKLTRDQLVAALGLDRPVLEQYLRWVGAIVLHGDLGQSLWQQNTAVTELLAARLPVTFQLGAMALVVALSIALPIGTYSALRQDTAGDYLGRSFSILLLAVPSFWLGTMVMVFPSIWWGWSPEVNYVRFGDDPLQNLKQMAVPAIVLGAGLSAITMRLMRTMMLEVLRQDYIRTAWAKGLPERLVVLRHALRNALTPIITLGALELGTLLSGAVLTEQVFTIPGFGKLIVDSVFNRDYAVVQGVVLVTASAYIVLSLLADIAYVLANPRLRSGG